MPSGGHSAPLDTRRTRMASARSVMKALEKNAQVKPFTVSTGRRRGVGAGSLAQPFPEPDPMFTGTRPEWAILWAHLFLGKKQNEDFQYISYVAGIQVDFEEFDLGIVLNIQGLYWHYEFSGGKVDEDLATRAFIEATGKVLINIDEDAALADPVYYLKEALNGRDHSLQAKGIA